MYRRSSRLLPVVLVAALLALAALVPTQPVRARGGFENHAYTYPQCDLVLQSGGGGQLKSVPANEGVTQPVIPAINVAACSVSITMPSPVFSAAGQFDVIEWNPLTLSPPAGSIALRTRAYDITALAYGKRVDFVPPLVTRTITHLADPPLTQLAINYVTIYNNSIINVGHASDGDAQTPIAYAYQNNGPRAALPGSHPVLSHAVCGGDAALQDLYLVQSVATTDVTVSGGYEYVQAFRVPLAADLKWIELAFGAFVPAGGPGPGVISIHDAEGATTPPAHLPAALTQSYFQSYMYTAAWGSHFDFDNSVALLPNHTYWLVVRTAYDYNLYTRTANGSENQDFLDGIGGLFVRSVPTVAWSPLGGRALSFKVIGDPVNTVGLAPIAPAPSSLRLQIHPNPARGPVFVRWSGARGARGALRFDVLDARGRRMAGGSGDGGAEGRWLWRASYDDGRALPAGVYFVRATDADGQRAVERVALVR